MTQGVIRHTLRTRAKYCLRGVRVGEAKNPGPHRRGRRRSESRLPGVVHHNLTLIDSSDDDVPLVVPRSGRESVQRMDDGIVHDPHNESDTECRVQAPQKTVGVVGVHRQVRCHPLVEAGNRQGNTAMEAEDTTDPDPLFVPMAGAMASGLQSLATVMRSIPKFMRGVFRGAPPGDHQREGGEQCSGGESGMEIVHAPHQIASLQTVARRFDP